MSSSNITINASEYYWLYEANDCMMLLNSYLTVCPNYDEIVGGNNTGLYWASLERNAGGAIAMAFKWTTADPPNNNLHFVANSFGGKTMPIKVRAFVAF